MVYPDRLQLPFSFDPVLLRRDLDALSATPWTAHFVRQNYEGDWSVIPLRCTAGETASDPDDLFRPRGHRLRRHAVPGASVRISAR